MTLARKEVQIVGRSKGQIMGDSVDRQEGQRQLQTWLNGRTINYQQEYKGRERALCVVHA